MDNQSPLITPNQTPSQSDSTPVAPTPAPASIIPPTPAKKGGGKVVLVVLLVVSLLAAGALGYLYYTTRNTLGEKKQELSKASQQIDSLEKSLSSSEAQREKEFIWQNNTELLSRSLCGGQPLLMSDVHLTEKFGTFRYLCANEEGGSPIRVAALKKLDDGTYEFTYGASTVAPSALPGYIYDEDPDFFGTHYGVSRF